MVNLEVHPAASVGLRDFVKSLQQNPDIQKYSKFSTVPAVIHFREESLKPHGHEPTRTEDHVYYTPENAGLVKAGVLINLLEKAHDELEERGGNLYTGFPKEIRSSPIQHLLYDKIFNHFKKHPDSTATLRQIVDKSKLRSHLHDYLDRLDKFFTPSYPRKLPRGAFGAF